MTNEHAMSIMNTFIIHNLLLANTELRFFIIHS